MYGGPDSAATRIAARAFLVAVKQAKAGWMVTHEIYTSYAGNEVILLVFKTFDTEVLDGIYRENQG